MRTSFALSLVTMSKFKIAPQSSPAAIIMLMKATTVLRRSSEQRAMRPPGYFSDLNKKGKDFRKHDREPIFFGRPAEVPPSLRDHGTAKHLVHQGSGTAFSRHRHTMNVEGVEEGVESLVWREVVVIPWRILSSVLLRQERLLVSSSTVRLFSDMLYSFNADRILYRGSSRLCYRGRQTGNHIYLKGERLPRDDNNVLHI
jgi:hypothetical protein